MPALPAGEWVAATRPIIQAYFLWVLALVHVLLQYCAADVAASGWVSGTRSPSDCCPGAEHRGQVQMQPFRANQEGRMMGVTPQVMSTTIVKNMVSHLDNITGAPDVQASIESYVVCAPRAHEWHG